MRSLAWITITLAFAGCDKKVAATGPGPQTKGKPVETQAANAPDQKPAFPGQTRAPYKTANVAFDVKVVASGFEKPWSVAFLPDGKMLVTEKPGRLRYVAPDGSMSPPISGTPEVDARDQGGLLDVLVDPNFATNKTIYLSYSEPRQGGNGTAVMRATLDGDRLTNQKVIWRMQPTLDSQMHFGSRLVMARDGTLFITTGERSIPEGRAQAQRLDSAFGKIIRINTDGSVPDDNPFVGKPGVLPEIYSYGHRNVQAAALNPETGKLWIVEHGTRGGDEINVIEPGKNYGWPVIAYGIEYKGGKIGEGITQHEGMEQPIYYWDPVIAPSGMAFYTANLFPAWRGSLFVGGLAGKHVARLTLDGTRVVGEERLLASRDSRFRDVRVGPDGAIYLLTDAENGELLKLVPKEDAETARR